MTMGTRQPTNAGDYYLFYLLTNFKRTTVLRLNHFENVDITNQLVEALNPLKGHHIFLQKHSICGLYLSKVTNKQQEN